ncbi:MAG: DUF1801 domain-containing protein [Phycisphaerales bacterium]
MAKASKKKVVSGRSAQKATALPASRPKGAGHAKAMTRGAKLATVSNGPRLLAGGNPQIAKGDGAGPVRAFIDAMPGWKRDVGRRLDALVVEIVPDVKKAVRWNSPFFGVEKEDGSIGWIMSLHCITRYVKVAFFDGTRLEPMPAEESKKEGIRYCHIFEDVGLDEMQMRSWIMQAARLPGMSWF